MSASETAVHEAGHAVAAILLDVPFERVSIVASDDHEGVVHLHASAVPLGEYDLDFSRERAEARIMVSLAGRAAASAAGFDAPSGCEHDDETAWTLAEWLSHDEAEAEALIAYLAIRTRNLLDAPAAWTMVQAVAEVLDDALDLDAVAVREVGAQAVQAAMDAQRDARRAP